MKKNSQLLLLGAAAVGAYLLLKKNGTIGNTGLNDKDLQDARNDPYVGTTGADYILSAPNQAEAVARGNEVLTGIYRDGLAFQPGTAINPPVNSSFNAFTAVTTVTQLPSYNASTNPFSNQGGQYPRVQAGILVNTPADMERLRIAWDNAHMGLSH